MKNNVKPKKKTALPESFQKLKVGMEVLYMSAYTLDRTSVKEVILKDDIAILANQVRVSRAIPSSGYLTPKNSATNAILRVWSPEVEEEYRYQLALRNIPNLCRLLEKLPKALGKEATINIHSKLNKLMNKYAVN